MIRLTGTQLSMPADCVLTFGKFESLHQGHRLLIAEVVRRAREAGWHSAVLTFAPHPRSVLIDTAYKSLRSADERAFILEKLGVDYMLERTFDSVFSRLSPQSFCEMVLDDLRARVVIAGEGSRFGHDRTGTLEWMRSVAASYNAEVCAMPLSAADDGGKKISTSHIRALIENHDFEQASRLLGAPYFIRGTVRSGRQLGRKLGFPTVNMEIAPDRFLPTDGVYATITEVDGTEFRGVTNIGLRPTVDNADGYVRRRTVETFLLDFDGDAYGKTLTTAFHAFLRPEQKFENIDVLKAQIARDVATVRG